VGDNSRADRARDRVCVAILFEVMKSDQDLGYLRP
jgi:hypothetical protein